MPVERVGNLKYGLGYMDMWVKWRNKKYRYGTRRLINQQTFQRWLVAATRLTDSGDPSKKSHILPQSRQQTSDRSNNPSHNKLAPPCW